MRKLSTGQDSTLASYILLSVLVFGPESPATKFLEKKASESPKGRDEEVVTDESQMVFLLGHLHMGGKAQ